jgi:oligopeptide/dipeptide ABC transporter ATP-binding protein
LRDVLGTRVAMVFQDPMNALTPHLTIGRQLSEVVLERGLVDAAQARVRCLEALRSVRMPDPEVRLRQFPHELSGGQRQRAAIAMALMTRPDLIIADEPTTALDVTVQAQVLDVLREARDRGLALVLITHDLGVVAGIADRVAVMYAGRVVECAPVRELFAMPAHPYTAALLASVPRLDAPLTGRLDGIEGQPPQPGEEPPGCAFAPRCRSVVAQCRAVRPALQAAGEHSVACHAPLARPGALP